MKILTAQNISKSFENSLILKNINFSIQRGDKIVIFGASGGGKSVLIKILAGLINPTEGKIICNEKIGFVFQSSALFDSLNIKNNIFFNCPYNKNLLESVLKQVNLKYDVIYKIPTEISGGMKRRVALARAIVHKASIMFLDEPTTGLDPISARALSKLIYSLNVTSVTVTHDILNAHVLGNYFVLLKDGNIYWEGPANSIDQVQNKYVREFFLLDS